MTELEKVKCPFCDKTFKVLWPHLHSKHNIHDMKKFRVDYPDVDLMAKGLKDVHRKNAFLRGFGKDRRGIRLTIEHRPLNAFVLKLAAYI